MSLQSLRAKLMLLIAGIFIGLMLVVFINNAIAYRELQNRLYDVTQTNLATFQNRIDDLFTLTENYLIDYALNNSDIFIIERNEMGKSEWFSANYRLNRDFASATTLYDLDCFFLYSQPSDTFISSMRGTVQTTTSNLINQHIEDYILANTGSNDVNIHHWHAMNVDSHHILVRILKINNSYIGAWVLVDNMLQPFAGEDLRDLIFLTDMDGQFLTSDPLIASVSIPPISEGANAHTVKIEDNTYLLVDAPMRANPFTLIALIPETQFNVDIQKYRPVLIVVLLMVTFFMLLTLSAITRLVVNPLDRLHEAIITLKQGNLNTSLPNAKVATEFAEINTTFNEMVQEIKTLQISFYEEKLEKQDISLDFLKLQIAPHFLINALSLAYQLSDLGRNDLTKALLQDLSQHLRYTLSSEKTVTLDEEMNHVRNYIEMSLIRYPNGIQLYEDIAPETLNAKVIPLILQSFVENTIKYEVVNGKTVDIHISSERILSDNEDLIHLTIWDTGRGFDPLFLEKLQDTYTYIQHKSSKHYGIRNVYQRASLVFGVDNCYFSFCNHPDAGAQIDIEIPYESAMTHRERTDI